ncbi:MAG: hypothetical protein IKO49_04420 [Bacilli bacterium]|nr:hypothetical protein [Bacilli bacterium]
MKVISQYEVNKQNAGPKAKIDVESILHKEYNALLRPLKIKRDLNSKINLLFFRIKKFFYIVRNKYIDDISVYQLPFNKSCKYNIKSEKSIGLIHDIEGLRNNDEMLLKREIELYQNFDVIISHNSLMTNFLKEHGLNKPIVNLEIFDYLVANNTKEKNIKHTNTKKVAFAGNFNKALFLSELEEEKMNFDINLYGVGKYNENNKKYHYFGSFLPDELPLSMTGDLGLVWDGGIDNSNINNNFLNYTKYNNPHKLSCYIAAGLPVIVWKEAACAKFVEDNNIGYTISNIYDINNIDLSDYQEKLKNVKKIKKKLTSGYYTITAVEKALEIINKK